MVGRTNVLIHKQADESRDRGRCRYFEYVYVIHMIYVCMQFISAISISGTQFVEKCSPIHLMCNVTGSEDLSLSLDWFIAGQKLLTSFDKQIQIHQHIFPSEKRLTSILDIEHAHMTDMGEYVCRASNKLATRIKVDVLNGKLDVVNM